MGDFRAQKTAPQPGSQEGFLRVRTSELRYEGVLRTVMGFPGGSDSEESACNVGDPDSIPGWRRRECLPTAVFLLGESHGQRSLVGSSPWGCKELGTTEPLTLQRTLIMTVAAPMS